MSLRPVTAHAARRRLHAKQLRWARGLPVGRFEGGYTLRPVGPERFWLTPDPGGFRFIRASGESLVVGAHESDGASVGPFLQLVSGVTRWKYYLATPLHDFGFVQHHKGLWPYSLEETNLMFIEAMKTMMTNGMVPLNLNDLINVYVAVMSPVGRAVWNGGGK